MILKILFWTALIFPCIGIPLGIFLEFVEDKKEFERTH